MDAGRSQVRRVTSTPAGLEEKASRCCSGDCRWCSRHRRWLSSRLKRSAITLRGCISTESDLKRSHRQVRTETAGPAEKMLLAEFARVRIPCRRTSVDGCGEGSPGRSGRYRCRSAHRTRQWIQSGRCVRSMSRRRPSLRCARCSSGTASIQRAVCRTIQAEFYFPFRFGECSRAESAESTNGNGNRAEHEFASCRHLKNCWCARKA